MDWYFIPLAAEAAGEGGQAGTQGFATMIVLVVAMIAIFYFIVIRPQKKQENRRRQMINSLSKSDWVVTIGGMVGQVAEISDDFVTLRVDLKKDVALKFRKSAIAALHKEKKEEAS